jgi:ribosomal protein L7Ae-like RNA K-turn-binding protein
MLGLARRAGKLACGIEAVLDAGDAVLILTASDAGRSVIREAERLNTRQTALPYDKKTFGSAVGRATCAIAALTDIKFYKSITEALQMEESE